MTLFLLALFFLVVPAPAQAWFGWLDNFSGPGPFNGAEFDFKLVCFANQPSLRKASEAMADAKTRTLALISAPEKTDLPAPYLNLQNMIAEPFVFKQTDGTRIKLDPTNRFNALAIAGYVARMKSAVSMTLPDTAQRKEAERAWEDSKTLWRESAVPSVAQPRVGFWASCTDRLRREPPKFGDVGSPAGDFVDIGPGDRHSFMSIVLNYRNLANTKLFHFSSEVARPDQPFPYADGAAIHLRIFEVKLAWSIPESLPKIGFLHPWLDFQHGGGIYQFSSAGFMEGSESFSGLVLEPLRFDVHSPGNLLDRIDCKSGACTTAKRIVLSLSYSFGWLTFPEGLSADDFAGRHTGVGPPLQKHEFLLEQGLVINVGRLFGL
jgi:hypothetical protein